MSTGPIPGFLDTFFGDQDKSFIDMLNEDLTVIRGQPILYYAKRDQTRRIDGDAPLQTADDVPPVVGLQARSGALIGAMYGEPVLLKNRIDSVRSEVEHDWNYADPIKLYAIALEPETEEDADERGTTYTHRLRVDIARVEAESVNIRPRQGDVIQLVRLLNSYYDVEDVSRTEAVFGGDGTFHYFKCSLVKNTKFIPPRKILPGGLGFETLE